jgi:ribonuclease G
VSGAHILVDRTVLDLRLARVEDGAVTSLRHHYPGRSRLVLGAVVEAKAGRFDQRLGGSFCEAGGAACFLPVKGGRPPAVGERFQAEVKREAIGGKAAQIALRPALRLPFATLRLGQDEPPAAGPLGGVPEAAREALAAYAAAPPTVPVLLTLFTALCKGGAEIIDAVSADDAAFLRPLLTPLGVEVRHRPAGEIRAVLDEAEEEALARWVPLPGGGRLVIDEAEAVTAIDVDLGAADGRSKAGAATKAGEAALAALSRHAVLRGLGGQIVIDLPRAAIRSPKIVRDQVMRALSGLGRISVPAVTGGGLVIAIAPRPGPSVRERLTEPFGEGVQPGLRLAADALAAKALRAAEAALEAKKTGPVRLACPARIAPYLEEAKPGLDARFGPRLEIEPSEGESIHAG